VKKIDIATEIYQKNKDKPRADVIQKIMDKLSVTKGNASIYYAKAKDRTDHPPKAKKSEDKTALAARQRRQARTRKEEPAENTDQSENETTSSGSGRYANTELRQQVNETIANADPSEIPEFLKRD